MSTTISCNNKEILHIRSGLFFSLCDITIRYIEKSSIIIPEKMRKVLYEDLYYKALGGWGWIDIADYFHTQEEFFLFTNLLEQALEEEQKSGTPYIPEVAEKFRTMFREIRAYAEQELHLPKPYLDLDHFKKKTISNGLDYYMQTYIKPKGDRSFEYNMLVKGSKLGWHYWWNDQKFRSSEYIEGLLIKAGGRFSTNVQIQLNETIIFFQFSSDLDTSDIVQITWYNFINPEYQEIGIENKRQMMNFKKYLNILLELVSAYEVVNVKVERKNDSAILLYNGCYFITLPLPLLKKLYEKINESLIEYDLRLRYLLTQFELACYGITIDIAPYVQKNDLLLLQELLERIIKNNEVSETSEKEDTLRHFYELIAQKNIAGSE